MENDKQPIETKLTNLMRVSVIIGIFLISFSVSYYFLYFLPQQEKMKTNVIKQKEAETKQKEEERQENLEHCLGKADSELMRWRKANGKGPTFSMPLELSNALDKKYKDTRDDCYKRYPSVK
jgi:hypothetical protein